MLLRLRITVDALSRRISNYSSRNLEHILCLAFIINRSPAPFLGAVHIHPIYGVVHSSGCNNSKYPYFHLGRTLLLIQPVTDRTTLCEREPRLRLSQTTASALQLLRHIFTASFTEKYACRTKFVYSDSNTGGIPTTERRFDRENV